MIHRNDNKTEGGNSRPLMKKKWTSQLQIKYAVDFRMFTSREGKWRWKNLYPYWNEMVWPVVHWSYPKRIMGWFFFSVPMFFFWIELILISYTIHVKFICSKQTLIRACMYWFRFTYKNSECKTLVFSFVIISWWWHQENVVRSCS